jgi:hypothetical protein
MLVGIYVGRPIIGAIDNQQQQKEASSIGAEFHRLVAMPYAIFWCWCNYCQPPWCNYFYRF